MKIKLSVLLLLFFNFNLLAEDFKTKPEVLVYRDGLISINSFVKSNPELFPRTKPNKNHVLNREQKEMVWSTWQSFLDYLMALDSLGEKYAPANVRMGKKEQSAYLIYYAAFLAKYRNSLEFIEGVDKDPGLTVLLNEPVPELKLPKGTYDKIKFRYLNVVEASEFTALDTVYKNIDGSVEPKLQEAIREDAEFIWAAGRGTGPALTFKNALQIVGSTGFGLWFPVQAGVAEWMGDTKVYRNGQSLISPEQIKSMEDLLEPGDILLERREWYLSNVGLPGYWPHAALYIGTPAEREKYFNDPTVQKWLRKKSPQHKNFEEFLQTTYPSSYELGQKSFEGHLPRVLEAMSEGVSFTSIEHSGAADALAILRPKLPKSEKAEAISRAFHYAGRPYDFNFDFRTDSTLVCSELVYKAYEPGLLYKGLQFELLDMMGRKVLPPNEMVRIFDRQYGTDLQQMDLVLFLDGNEKKGKAIQSDLATFRQSYTRPKWHIMTQ